MRVDGAVCLITGASSGIGAATARHLARRGGRVLLAGRDAARLDVLAEETGGVPLVADLADGTGATTVAEQALAAAGHVDLLVNNAGLGWAGDFATMSTDDIATLVAVNLTAPLVLTRLLLPGMRTRGQGHVVLVSSIAGCVGVGREAAYSATKAGMNAFAASLRYELAGSGVGVSVVVPGVVDTAFFARRGTPYARSRPRPIPADRVALAVLGCVERNRVEAFRPRWLRVPSRLNGATPGVFRRLAARANR